MPVTCAGASLERDLLLGFPTYHSIHTYMYSWGKNFITGHQLKEHTLLKNLTIDCVSTLIIRDIMNFLMR